MFAAKPKNDIPELEEAIVAALKQLDYVPAYSQEYVEIVNQIERLNALKQKNTTQSVDPNVLATVLGNLVGIVIIVGHERAHLVTSKALMFVKSAVR